MSLQALYSTIKGEVDSDSDSDGSEDSDMDLKNISPDRLMFATNFDATDNLFTCIQVNTVMYSENDGKEQQFDGYILVDASIKYDMQKYGRLTFAAENVMDKFYVGYFSQIRKHSSYYFSGRGRNYSLSYQFNF